MMACRPAALRGPPLLARSMKEEGQGPIYSVS